MKDDGNRADAASRENAAARSVRRILTSVLSVSSLLAALSILSLTAVIVAEITSRAMSNPIAGATDLGSMLLISLVFLALAATQAERGHVSMDAVVAYFPDWLKKVADKLGLMICLAIGLVLLDGTARSAYTSFIRGELSLGLAYPLWPARLLIAVGFLLYDIVVIVQLFGLHFDGEHDRDGDECGAE